MPTPTRTEALTELRTETKSRPRRGRAADEVSPAAGLSDGGGLDDLLESAQPLSTSKPAVAIPARTEIGGLTASMTWNSSGRRTAWDAPGRPQDPVASLRAIPPADHPRCVALHARGVPRQSRLLHQLVHRRRVRPDRGPPADRRADQPLRLAPRRRAWRAFRAGAARPGEVRRLLARRDARLRRRRAGGLPHLRPVRRGAAGFGLVPGGLPRRGSRPHRRRTRGRHGHQLPVLDRLRPGARVRRLPAELALGIPYPRDLELVLSARDKTAPRLDQAADRGILPAFADCQDRYASLRAAARVDA